MPGILIAFSQREHADKLKRLLLRSGFEVNAVCSSAAQALALMDDREGGLILCGYQLRDAIFSELAENMPDSFFMIVHGSPGRMPDERLPDRVEYLPVPVKSSELAELIRSHEEKQEIPAGSNWRKERDRKLIEKAKAVLMEKKNMDEPEAHHYLQKYAMDSGIRLVETAEKILTLYE